MFSLNEYKIHTERTVLIPIPSLHKLSEYRRVFLIGKIRGQICQEIYRMSERMIPNWVFGIPQEIMTRGIVEYMMLKWRENFIFCSGPCELYLYILNNKLWKPRKYMGATSNWKSWIEKEYYARQYAENRFNSNMTKIK